MSESQNLSVSMSVDLKKNRLRIYKTGLHLIGDPEYIQLLINPVQQIVAIKAVNEPTAIDQAHKVPKRVLRSDNSVEIYSMTFVSKFKEVAEIEQSDRTYRMSGMMVPSHRMVIFSMKSLSEV